MQTPPYTTRSGLRIGSRFEQPQRPRETTYTEDQVQAALLSYRNKSANDSRIMGSSRDLHRVRVGKRSAWWRITRVLRELRRWLLSARAW